VLRLIFLLLFSYSVNASDPTFTVGTDPIIDITNTGTGLSLGDDQMSGMKDIGFDFTFYDQTFDQVNISMNGFFTFQSNFSVPRSRNYLSESLPASSFNYSVFPAWSDYIRRSNGNQSPYIQTFGQTSDTDQYFVIMWDNVSEYSNGLKSTFQAILYETTNKIDFRYKNLRIQTHDITIGLQGNNEAVTHLRYEDNNNTTYIIEDAFSLSTGIDESYSNLSTECLTNSNYSALCDVYDLGSDSEEDDILDFIDNLLGNDTEDYGYSAFDDIDDDIYLGFDTINYETGEGLATDIYIIDIEEDITLFELEEELDFENNIFIEPDYVDVIDVVGNDNERPLDILELPTVDLLPDIYPEDNYIEIAEVLELEEMPEEIIEELEEELEEIVFEEILEEPIEELEEIDEIDEPEERENNVRRNVVSTNNYINDLTSSIVSQSNSSSQLQNNAVSGSSDFSQSGISNQIAAEQTQTQNALQSVQTIEVNPIGNDAMGVAIVQVQTVTTDSITNEIQSITTEVMTSSEADQVVASVIQSNMESLQEEIEENQNESGEYDVQGQSSLIALMNYKQGWDNYSAMSIPDVTFYEPYEIYTNVVLSDNINAHISMTEASSIAMNKMVSSQNLDLFRRY
jgi:hypothetical protein|tara:strand:- start:1916 stop:3796 length:1881 start_codon:yes stop_codon:yes gene_type:complete